MTDELLRLEDIACRDDRGLPLLEHVSFSLTSGSILWVIGPTGSGKTTLLLLLIKERRLDHGSIYFRGHPLWGVGSITRTAMRRQMGMIFQEDNLLSERTVFDNAAAALRLTGCSQTVLRDQTYQALTDVGLTAKAEQNVRLLSSSERRLLALARVLAKRPPLVVADLNTCEVDQNIIAPRLESLASYGSGVLILSKQHRTDAAKTLSSFDLALR